MNLARYVVLCALAVLVLGGCQQPSQLPAGQPAQQPASSRASNLVVGFVSIRTQSAWRKAQADSIVAEAGRRNVHLLMAEGASGQEQQVRTIREFLARKVDVIVLSPIVATGWEDVLREALRAGVPAILLERPVDVPEGIFTCIGHDYADQGRCAGQWLTRKLGGQGKVVELQGVPGAAVAADRGRGFRQVVSACPGVSIVASQAADFQQSMAKQAMEGWLKTGVKDFTAVYAHNDDMALGAIAALEEAGLKPGKDILVVSIDGVRAAFEAIIAGKLSATVENAPDFGPAVMDAVDLLAAGKTLPRFIPIPPRLIERADAERLLKTRKY